MNSSLWTYFYKLSSRQKLMSKMLRTWSWNPLNFTRDVKMIFNLYLYFKFTATASLLPLNAQIFLVQHPREIISFRLLSWWLVIIKPFSGTVLSKYSNCFFIEFSWTLVPRKVYISIILNAFSNFLQHS